MMRGQKTVRTPGSFARPTERSREAAIALRRPKGPPPGVWTCGRRTVAGGLAVALMAALAAGSPLAPGHAGTVFVPAGAGLPSVPVISMKERRFLFVVRQEYDFSCGSAALATLLTYHYDSPTTEQDVFMSMFEVGDRQRIQREGFSLADMQKYLHAKGLRSNGFNVTLPQLAEANIPAITLINTNGYRHFVVIKGISDKEVLVGDPALGVKSYSIPEFEAVWIPIAFIIEERIDTARENYGKEEEWNLMVKSPIGDAMSPRDLGTFTINLPAFNQF